MGQTRAVTPTLQLTGRDRECAEIDRLLDQAAHGESGSLVVRGEAGIGKTALLDYAANRATEMTVLRATGVEAESDLAFAGLFGLLRPATAHLRELPEIQAAALGGALGLSPSAGPDRFLVSAAVLGLLAAAAEEGPVLCLVDDAQWLDTPSAEALVFVGRRLHAERIAILFAAREGDVRSFASPGIRELALDGLDAASATALFAERAGAAAMGVRERLLEEAAGNPLALLELPAALSPDQLTGRSALPESIPLTVRLQDAFLARFELLPDATRALLLIAAADDTGDAATVLRAGAQLDLAPAALDPAEAGDLVTALDARIEFRHPLVRSAIYRAATLTQRQRAHAALASALSGEEHADRRVWHDAMATLSGDEQVAAALEASARRSRMRAGHASAATAFQRAAQLTVDESRLAPRLAWAAEAAWDAGQPDRARDLIGRALPLAEEALRARLLYLRGVIESRTGSMRDAVATLLDGAETSTDPSLTLEILHEAAEAAADTGDLAKVGEFGARAAKLPAPTRRAEFSRLVMAGFARLFAGEEQPARAIFDDALKLADELRDDPRAQVWAANVASGGFDLGAGLPFSTRAVQLARSQGLLSLLPIALEQQALDLLWNSRFDQAYAAAEEGYVLSLDLGHGWGWHMTTMTCVEAVWGQEAEARQHAAQVFGLAQRSGETILTTMSHAALGLLELTLGRPAEAANQLLEITAAARPDTHPIVAIASVPDAVEACVRDGRPVELITGPLARFRGWVEHAPTDARRSLLARCEALLEQRPPEEAFSEAGRLAIALSPFQQARGELLYGEWLRRARNRTEARIHLRAAADLFGRLGAVPWEQRAEGELRATGETTRKRDPSTLDELTPQELQIARLVADGLTNRQIAAQLYLSPRTIDYHLRKVFSKLGIASRIELARSVSPAVAITAASTPSSRTRDQTLARFDQLI